MIGYWCIFKERAIKNANEAALKQHKADVENYETAINNYCGVINKVSFEAEKNKADKKELEKLLGQMKLEMLSEIERREEDDSDEKPSLPVIRKLDLT